MKVLVTGAGGFLGGHLVDECVRRGDEVRVLVRPSSDLSHLRTVPGLEFAYGDLVDKRSLLKAARGVETVLHSAGRAQELGTRQQFWSDNVHGTLNLLAAARTAGCARFVHVSSPSAVMDGRDQWDIDESVPYPRRFLNHYSETKAVAEQAVRAANTPGFTTVALRPRSVWGPRDRTGVFPRLMKRLAQGTLPDLSRGVTVHASLCHCVNAARACRLAADSHRVGGKVYFVSDAEPVDLWGLITRLAEMFAVDPPTRTVPPPLRDLAAALFDGVWRIPSLARTLPPPLSRYTVALLTRSGTYDTTAAERDLGYRPVVDLETGLRGLERWVAEIGGLSQLVAEVRW